MIINFKHKGLKLLYEQNDHRKVGLEHADKIKRILFLLEQVREPAGLKNFPEFKPHNLTGNYKGYISMKVSKNWRLWLATYFSVCW